MSDDLREETRQPSTFEEVLARDGRLVYRNKGVSMMPLLRQERDLFVIERNTRRLRRFDVALFRRGKQYVLHRVVKVLPESYIIRGDNCIENEPVREEQVLGVMTSFVRDGKETAVTAPAYRVYVVIIYVLYPLRVVAVKAKRGLRKILRQ